jgi:hypothetical protein
MLCNRSKNTHAQLITLHCVPVNYVFSIERSSFLLRLGRKEGRKEGKKERREKITIFFFV